MVNSLEGFRKIGKHDVNLEVMLNGIKKKKNIENNQVYSGGPIGFKTILVIN